MKKLVLGLFLLASKSSFGGVLVPTYYKIAQFDVTGNGGGTVSRSLYLPNEVVTDSIKIVVRGRCTMTNFQVLKDNSLYFRPTTLDDTDRLDDGSRAYYYTVNGGNPESYPIIGLIVSAGISAGSSCRGQVYAR
jgi:hypothetical protein